MSVKGSHVIYVSVQVQEARTKSFAVVDRETLFVLANTIHSFPTLFPPELISLCVVRDTLSRLVCSWFISVISPLTAFAFSSYAHPISWPESTIQCTMCYTSNAFDTALLFDTVTPKQPMNTAN